MQYYFLSSMGVERPDDSLRADKYMLFRQSNTCVNRIHYAVDTQSIHGKSRLNISQFGTAKEILH